MLFKLMSRCPFIRW